MADTLALPPLPEARPPVWSLWRHLKRGTRYNVVGFARDSATLEWRVQYVGEKGDPWSRPVTEFMDGRFERIDQEGATNG